MMGRYSPGMAVKHDGRYSLGMAVKHDGQVLVDGDELCEWSLSEQLLGAGLAEQIAERPVGVGRPDKGRRPLHPVLLRVPQPFPAQVAATRRPVSIREGNDARRACARLLRRGLAKIAQQLYLALLPAQLMTIVQRSCVYMTKHPKALRVWA